MKQLFFWDIVLMSLDSSLSLKLSAFFNFNIVPFFMAWFLLYCGWTWRCVACLLLAVVKRLLSNTYHDVRFKWLKYPKRLKTRISVFPDIAAERLQNPEMLRFSISCTNNIDSSTKRLKNRKKLKSTISAFSDISAILVWNGWNIQNSSDSQN